MKLVILDRDGTLNEDRDDFVKSPGEWVPLPGALEAVARLNRAGWKAVVATNQSGLARGLFDRAALDAMHAKMNELLAQHGGRVEAVYFCPHGPDEGCDCRKPLPGLFRRIGEDLQIDLRGVPTVGDTLRDLQAGAALGCETHLVLTGKAARLDADQLADLLEQVPEVQVHDDLAAFVEALLQHERVARGHTGEGDTGYGMLE